MEDKKIKYCRNCGNKISADSKFCTECGEKQLVEGSDYTASEYISEGSNAYDSNIGKKNKSNKWVTVFLAISIFVLCVLVGFYTDEQEINRELSSEITKLQSENERLKNQVNTYKPKASNYDSIVGALKQYTMGYGNNGFYLSEGVVHVGKRGSEYITLTANAYTTYHLIGVSGNSSSVSWNENWSGNTNQIKITGGSTSGVSLYKITNDAGNSVIYFMVIVE